MAYPPKAERVHSLVRRKFAGADENRQRFPAYGLLCPNRFSRKRELTRTEEIGNDRSDPGDAGCNRLPKSPAAWTGDVRGFEFIHNEPTFKPLFDTFEGMTERYLEAMGLDADQLNLYFTRSWAVVSGAGERVNRHAHIQSHISLIYYLQKPRTAGRIAFLHPSPPNEFAPGLFEAKMNSLFKGPRDEANSNNLIVDIQEGDLLIFPSRTEHATEPHDSTEPRISISADVMVTLKDSTKHEFLLPDPAHWRKMGD